jgi:hypothetical protein
MVLMFPFAIWPTVEINKKPTTVSSRGFLSKVVLRATRPSGVVSYDDYQADYDLQRDQIHWAKNKTRKSIGQAWIRPRRKLVKWECSRRCICPIDPV